MPHAPTTTTEPASPPRHPYAGPQARHRKIPPHGDRDRAALADDHPALRENRTIYPTTVRDADAVPRVLISGNNARKIGKRITKGAWAGFPVYTLTLEERATCPPCGLKSECYGNGMHYARRIKPGPTLIAALDIELRALARAHAGGFAVRVHVLGDFYDEDYLGAWACWMRDIPALHVWGYTAHAPASPIGALIEEANVYWPDRWVIRFSRNPMPAAGKQVLREVTTIWRHPSTPTVEEGTVCPASADKTACCATCGLCWAPEAAATRIVFIGHGRQKSLPAPAPAPATERPPFVVDAAPSRWEPDYKRGYNAGYAAGRKAKAREVAA